MAEHMRGSLNKSSKFYGTLITANSSKKARVTGIKIPDLGERYFTLRRSDLKDDAVLTVFSGTLPVLSEESVLYPQQPVMALFGPDSESVGLLSKDIRLTLSELEEEEESAEAANGLSYGTEPAEEEEYRVITSSVRQEERVFIKEKPLTCECWQEGERVHIEVPAQWPALIRTNVARLLDMQEVNVIVHQMPYSALHDEYLIQPVILSAIAALAAVKAGLPVVLTDRAFSVSPRIEINRTTKCSTEGKPVSEECRMTAWLGAYALDDAEFIRQSLTGLLPNYPVKSFRAEVSVKRSRSFPSLFFSGAGYSDALLSTERHATMIADSFETPPAKWKEYVASAKRPFTDYMPSADLRQLAALTAEIEQESDFNRKWASYATQTDEYDLFSFTRGIGLASGYSISGFSTSHNKEYSAQAKITLTEKHNITLLTSFPPSDEFSSLVTKTIRSEIDMGRDSDVIILDNDGTMTDSGADVLERAEGHFPIQLAAACGRLNIQKDEAPVSIVFDCDEKLCPCEFEQRGMAGIIIETKLDNLSFDPVVLEAWVCASSCQEIPDLYLNSMIRRQLISTLRDCGAKFSSDPQRPFRINIVRKDWPQGGLTSLASAVRGLTKAAFLSAMKLCLSGLDQRLPLDAQSVEKAYRQTGGRQ